MRFMARAHFSTRRINRRLEGTMELQFARVARLTVMAGLCASGATAWSQNTPALPAASAPPTVEVAPARQPANSTRPTDALRSMDATTGQPEGRVTPQIRIPLGTKPPVARTPSAAEANTPGGDAAARCEAQRGEQVRARCRDRLARESK